MKMTFAGPDLTTETRTLITAPTLTVEGPGITLLSGPNGSGKTTLLDAIYADHLEGGSRLTLEPRGSRVGYIPQASQLFERITVQENLELITDAQRRRGDDADEHGIASRIAECLAKCHTEHLKDSTLAALSGGERKRVDIAAALLFTPDILLVDEPYESLDRQSRGEIRDLLEDISHNARIILVDHMRFGPAATQSISILDGLLTTDSTFHD